MTTAYSIVQSGDLIGAVTEDVFISDEERYLAVAQILINHPHIDLNKKDPEGKTALHWACSNNNYDKIAQEIIIRQADCNVVDDFGNTPLMKALDHFCLDTVRLLLEHGADPALSGNAHTCFSLAQTKNLPHLAAIFKNIELKNKQRSVYSSEWHKDAKSLYMAIMANDILKVGQLLSAKPALVNYQKIDGSTPLHWAVEVEKVDMVDCILGYHPNIELTMWDGTNVLHTACQTNQAAIAQAILNCNQASTPHLTAQQNIDGLNPLGLCILEHSRKHPFVGLLELFKAVAPHCSPDTLNSALTDAAYSLTEHPEFEQVCLILLESGADINAQNSDGWTLLHGVVNEPKNNTEFIHWLIDNGVNTNLTNDRGATAQDIASDDNIGVIEAYVSKQGLVKALDDVEKPTTTRKI